MALARFGGTAALMAASPGLPWKPLLLAAVAGVALGVWSLQQPVGKVAGAAAPEAVAKAQSSANGAGNTASAAASIAPTTAPPAGTDVDAWLAAAEGDDAAARLTAIRALAQAPRDRALPVLARIAERGQLERDRHAALEALQGQVALHGDADDAVHGVLRSLAYDGTDERVSERALRLLESIDADAAR